MNFHSLYDHGFARVAAVSIPVHPARPELNADEVIAAATVCSNAGTAVVTFPELCLSGYSLDDLFLQSTLLDAVEAAIVRVVEASRDLLPLLWVGAPLRHGNRLYNCALAIHRGTVLAVTPKRHITNYNEFYEKRHFAAPTDPFPKTIDLPFLTPAGEETLAVPFGTVVVSAEDVPGLTVAAEICEDLWVPTPPSTIAALQGAHVLVNLSASPATVGRAAERSKLVAATSSRLKAAYVYAAAGEGESTTDLAWDGHTMVYEAGTCLAEGERFSHNGATFAFADVDLDGLANARARYNSFDDNASGVMGLTMGMATIPPIPFRLNPPRADLGLIREIERFPFVPSDPDLLEQECWEAYNIQVSALAQRLKAIGNPKIVIGVSGGLDSTHALLVAAQAMDRLNRPRTDILAYTMPGFATTDHTKSNAYKLCEHLGTSFEEIGITPAARQMLTDMKHPFSEGADVFDVTFENVQAGLRTDYLFRLANHHRGIVLGTGDLSELALGWCTYGVGDQMSHYGVNAGIPKTMIQHLIRWVIASDLFGEDASAVLDSILNTEISPELIPTTAGKAPQSTQASIGPYNLQDFTLFHFLRHGARPSKIAFMAMHAWGDATAGRWPEGFPEESRVAYSLGEIVKWERVFLRRFFANQFKRSAMPNGPKVLGGGSLSPRGDWRMPSDVSGTAWLAELDEAVAGLELGDQ